MFLKYFFLIALSLITLAFTKDDTLRVSVKEFPPFIIKTEAGYQGFDIDLWEAIAHNLDQPFRYVTAKTLPDLFAQIDSGISDLGIAGITINSEREKFYDFSHSYISTGLTALVHKSVDKTGFQFFKSVFTPGVQKILWLILIFIISCSHLIWFFERGQDSFHDKYIPGVFEGAWWTIVTMSTVGYGDIAPKRWAGRITAVFVILTGITFFGIAVAELSTSFTQENLTANIKTVDDLQAKKVAVIKGTTSFTEAQSIGAIPIPVSNITEAIEFLSKKKVVAVVADEPLLRYTLKTQNSQFSLLSPILTQQYGLVFPSMSKKMELINREILKIKESGKFSEISQKWFDSGS